MISDLCTRSDNDPCVISSKEYLETSGETKLTEVLNKMLICLYHVGAIGIKMSSLSTFIWSFLDQSSVSRGEVKRAQQLKIHKMLYRALDIEVDDQTRFHPIDEQ
ncbi:hypothetical protein D3C76_1461510 [compost metagenome]